MLVFRVFPNGEFVHGVDTSRARKRLSTIGSLQCKYADGDISAKCTEMEEFMRAYQISDFNKPGQQYADSQGDVYTVYGVDLLGVRVSFKSCDGKHSYGVGHLKESLWSLCRRRELVPLGSSIAPNLKKSSRRRGSLRMSSSKARNIRNAAFLMGKRGGGRRTLSFLTLTLPAVDPVELEAICRRWGEISHRFFSWLRSRLLRAGISPEWVYCTELQSSRGAAGNGYAPHLHIIFRGRLTSASAWIVSATQCRKAWGKAIFHIIGREFDNRALENIQAVKKDAGRYLSKYLGKGVPLASCPPGSPESWLETYWGGMTRELSAYIRRASLVFYGEIDNSSGLNSGRLVRSLPLLLERGMLRYYSSRFIETSAASGAGIHVGCGMLRSPSFGGGFVSIASEFM